MRTFLITLSIFIGFTRPATGQNTQLSTINLKVSNVCEHYGQIIGLNSPDSSDALPTFGNAGCPWQSLYVHQDSLGLQGKLRYMNIDPTAAFNSSPKYLTMGDENRILIYNSEVFPQTICNATITPYDTLLLDSVLNCMPYNFNLYVIRNSIGPGNFQAFTPPFQSPNITLQLNIKPLLMDVNYGFAAVVGEGPGGEIRLNVVELGSGLIVRDTALGPQASNPKSINFQFPGLFIASSPGDTAITITRCNSSHVVLGTTVIHSASGLNTGDFEYGYFHFQPLTDPTGNNDDLKVFRYELSSMSLYATFNISKRLHKLIYAAGDYYYFMHAVEESPANDHVFVYDYFNYQPADSFVTTAQTDFIVTDFRCFVNVPEYDDHLVKIKAYPNPTNGMITIKASGLICGRDYSMDIADISGNVVFRKTIHTKMSLEIPMDDLPAGVYFLRIHTKKGIVSERIMKT